MNSPHQKLQKIFTGIVIYLEYAPKPLTISRYNWNGSLQDFIVEYYINQKRFVFHYSNKIAAGLGVKLLNLDPFQQLEKEVKYIKRMYERGIGSEEYYPFTEIVS